MHHEFSGRKLIKYRSTYFLWMSLLTDRWRDSRISLHAMFFGGNFSADCDTFTHRFQLNICDHARKCQLYSLIMCCMCPEIKVFLSRGCILPTVKLLVWESFLIVLVLDVSYCSHSHLVKNHKHLIKNIFTFKERTCEIFGISGFLNALGILIFCPFQNSLHVLRVFLLHRRLFCVASAVFLLYLHPSFFVALSVFLWKWDWVKWRQERLWRKRRRRTS